MGRAFHEEGAASSRFKSYACPFKEEQEDKYSWRADREGSLGWKAILYKASRP
jgi:hypothetical protein